MSRSEWDQDDGLRPLSPRGRRQSQQLVDILTEHKPTRILSSPYLRCVDTMEPLAEALGVPVGRRDALAEGSTLAAVRLVRRLTADDAVLCSHGDVIPFVLAMLDAEYGLGIGPAPRNAKASVWVLEARKGRFTRATYVKVP